MVKSTKITNIKINKFYEWSFFWTFGLDFHSIGMHERGKKEKGGKNGSKRKWQNLVCLVEVKREKKKI